jgi:AraC-like DNA-binding protein
MELVVFAALHFELDSLTAGNKAKSAAPLHKLLDMVRTQDKQQPRINISQCMMKYLDHLSASMEEGSDPGYALHSVNIELLTEYQEKQTPAPGDETALNTTMMLIRNEVILYPNIHVHSLRSLAKKHFINEKSLSRAFTKTFGIKIRDFILQQVMKRAKYLLENTDRPIMDIAEELGYSNDYNFSRTFKSMYNVYPASFRKNNTHSSTY